MLLASCGTDLKLHNCTNYDLLHVYRPSDSTGQIRNVSWCKDGSWLAIVPNRGNAEIIRTKEDVRLLQTILGVAQPTAAVFQRTTKRNLAMSTVNGSVLVYDIKVKSVKKRFTSSGSSVTLLDWNVKDSHLAAGSTDGQITLYSNTTNQKSSIISLPESKSVSVVRFHSTVRHILGSASDEGVVSVWDINTSRPKLCLKSHQAPVTDIVFSSQNSNLMVSVGLDRTFQCYDTTAGLVALSVMTDHPLSAVDITPDGYLIAAGSSRGNIYIYDLRNYQRPLKIISAHSGEIKKVLYQPFAVDSTDSLNIQEEKTVSQLEAKTSSIDSFGNMLSNVEEFSSNNQLESESAAGDSFLKDFDVMKKSYVREKSELSNLGLSDSVRKWLDTKKEEKNSDIPSLKISASTPRQNERIISVQNQELGPQNISPIISSSTQSVSKEEIGKIVSEIVSEVVSEQVGKMIKNDITEIVNEQMSELRDDLSRHFLNLQLSFSKQFVGQEGHIQRLFKNYHGSIVDSNLSAQIKQLKEENEFLKSKMNEMFRQNNS